MFLCSISTSINCSPTAYRDSTKSLGPEKSLRFVQRQFIEFMLWQIEDFTPIEGCHPPIRPLAANRPINANAVCDYPNQTHLQYPAFLRHVGKNSIIDRRDVAVRGTKGDTQIFPFSSASACCCASGTVAVSITSWLHSLTIFRVEGITQAIAEKLKQNSVTTRNPAGNNNNHERLPSSSRHHSAMHPSCLTALRTQPQEAKERFKEDHAGHQSDA